MKIKALTTFMAGVLVAATCLMSSCLKSDVVEYTFSSDTSITSFSLGTLKVKRIGTYKSGDKKGEDSIYYENIDMGNYPFTIDQIHRKIENKDSLPVGTDISKVLTKITADTPYIIYKKIKKADEEPTDTLWTETDSIDFSLAPNGLDFQVVAASGAKGKPYSVKVNVHTLDPDSLKWFAPLKSENAFEGNEVLTQQKALFANGKIFVFGKNKNNRETSVQYTQLNPVFNSQLNVFTDVKANPWVKITTADNIIENAVPTSAMVWNEKIYFISNHMLYTLDPAAEAPFNIQQAQEQSQDVTLIQLIAGINSSSNTFESKLYACTDHEFVTYTSGKWMKDKASSDATPLLPDSRFTSITLPVVHNSQLVNTIVMTNDTQNKEANGIVLKRHNTEAQWIGYNYEQIDTLGCPNITDLSMIHYNKKLYAFGGNITSKQHKEKFGKPFSAFFVSEDNGLTWKPDTLIHFPTTGKEANKKNLFEDYYKEGEAGQGTYSAIVDDHHFIWIIWHNGSMSHGRINHLGFAPKW